MHDSQVRAFGITDYFSADCYFTARTEYQLRYPDAPKLFLPNVELRTGDVVNKAQEEVNVHLIFNPFLNDHEEKIRSFLGFLKTSKTIGASGKHLRASELKHRADFAEATTTRAFISEALEETYGTDVDLLDYLLIVTAANNDGIRAIRGKQRKLLITDEIDKFSNAFFGNRGNRDYFLRTDRAQEQGEFILQKPVLSGCDAHSLADLDTGLGRVVHDPSGGKLLEPTWIKADLTYEGLKQIIFEPSDRVFIGKEPEIEVRVRENKTKYIEALQLTSVDGYDGQHGAWFNEEKILLGKELVAIIGNKGSGKSAVTDAIGLLGNSHNQSTQSPDGRSRNLFSFLNSEKFLKKGCASNFVGTLNWYEGEPDKKNLNGKVDQTIPERVEYLPQKYLEGICANIADDEFRSTLDKVIFRYVRPQDLHGQRDLAGLVKFLATQVESKIHDFKHDLHLANEEIVSIEKRLVEDYEKKVKEKLRLRQEELAVHVSNRPEAVPKPPEKDSDVSDADVASIEELSQEIDMCDGQIERLEKERGDTNRALEELRQFRQAIEREAGNLARLESQYQKVLDSEGLQFDDVVQLSLDYTKLDAHIVKKSNRLDEINELLATEEELAAKYFLEDDVEDEFEKARSKSIVFRKANLRQKKKELVEKLAAPGRAYQAFLTNHRSWDERKKIIRGADQDPTRDSIKGLEKELESIRTVYPNTLRRARDERELISKKIFRKKREYTRVYEVIKQSIDREIENCRDELGGYSISVEAGLRLDSSFVDQFLRFVNQNKRGSFYGREEGRARLQSSLASLDTWESEGEVFNALNEIVEALHADKRDNLQSGEDKRRDVFKQMIGQDQSLIDLYDFLFGFDYLSTKYDLKVDKKDLSELSPGERGGLLLIFYLMLDKRDIPLVIDQPEDNLDNKSVYQILVTFIKRAKKRRQIILVTHNPNLAVVADAEQIIHVSIDKTDGKHDFDFFSGAIENPRVNRAVVDILEGTLPAFNYRRLKYRR